MSDISRVEWVTALRSLGVNMDRGVEVHADLMALTVHRHAEDANGRLIPKADGTAARQVDVYRFT